MEMANDYSRRLEYERMLDAYKKQDLPCLYQLMEASKDEGDDLKLPG